MPLATCARRSRPAARPAAGRLALTLLLLGLWLAPAAASAQTRYAAIVVDVATGRVLQERHADELRYPASLTKMMTLYLLFEAVRQGRVSYDTSLPVSRRAAGMAPSKLGLRAGQTIRVEDAIGGLVTRSANDVAVVVAEALAGTESEFAQVMTRKARALGMGRTTFRNASGLPDGRQQSTARDMATLARALLRDFPVEYRRFSMREFRYGGQVHRNHNGLLQSYAGLDGIKTGYIRASGYNIAASAIRDGRRVVAVVFGGRTAHTRNSHAVELLDRAFAQLPSLPEPRLIGPPARKPVETVVASAETAPLGPPALKPEDALPVPLVAALLEPPAEAEPEREQGSGELGAVELAGEYGIQLGAFQEAPTARELAEARARELGARALGAQIHVSPVDGPGGRLFRALLLGLSPEDAEAACESLKARAKACMLVRVALPQEVAGEAGAVY